MIKQAIAAAALLSVCASPSMAEDFAAGGISAAEAPLPAWSRPNHTIVSIQGLDLNLESDARRALIAIERAAAELCGRPSDISHPVQIAWVRECTEQATRDAVVRLNHPIVTAAFEESRLSPR